ncbi:MAG: ABC transporter ATP-binding protein [Ruminiclostridium sp.]|nr:ABC transporter ATP-binding protein [Ruminiclostridium sp.]
MENVFLSCNSITKEYQTAGGVFTALKDVSLEIKKGEYLCIVGKSGSGKSTLMNIIGLIETPTAGEITIDGKRINDCSEKEKNAIRNQTIGYIFQSFFLEPSYTVYQNVEIPLLIRGVPKKERKKLIADALNDVGLADKSSQCAATLSGGEKQRVAIARALVNSPSLILADEPCGNLDSENTGIIMDIFDELHKKGKTLVLITHSETDSMRAERRIAIKDGYITDEYKM